MRTCVLIPLLILHMKQVCMPNVAQTVSTTGAPASIRKNEAPELLGRVFLGELTAGGIDVVAAGIPDGSLNANAGKCPYEHVGLLSG